MARPFFVVWSWWEFLAACNAAPVGEHGKHQCVDTRTLPKNIEDAVDPFINKRDGSDLNPDELFARRRFRGALGSLTSWSVWPCHR